MEHLVLTLEALILVALSFGAGQVLFNDPLHISSGIVFVVGGLILIAYTSTTSRSTKHDNSTVPKSARS